jgi:hypothetical protein
MSGCTLRTRRYSFAAPQKKPNLRGSKGTWRGKRGAEAAGIDQIGSKSTTMTTVLESALCNGNAGCLATRCARAGTHTHLLKKPNMQQNAALQSPWLQLSQQSFASWSPRAGRLPPNSACTPTRAT